MKKEKIGIVEDDLTYATLIKRKLESMNYIVLKPCSSYKDAVAMIDNEKPDLIILDINLSGDRDGVDVASYIRLNHNMPLIFHTFLDDETVMERIKKVQPDALLIKPFRGKDLLVAIELAINDFKAHVKNNTVDNADNNIVKDSFFIKDGAYFLKIKFDEVLYMQSEGPYFTLHTETKKYLVRGSISEYIEKIPAVKFFRVHRSYVVNLDKVDKINSISLTIKGETIPISKNYRDELLTLINFV